MKYLDLSNTFEKCKVGDVAYYANAISIVLKSGDVTVYRNDGEIVLEDVKGSDLHHEDGADSIATVWRKVSK